MLSVLEPNRRLPALLRLSFPVLVMTGFICLEAAAQPTSFSSDFSTPFGVPPFTSISLSELTSALREGIRQQRQRVEQIAANPAPPTFANTIEALERSGPILSRVLGTIDAMATSDSVSSLLVSLGPELVRHQVDVFGSLGLVRRVRMLYANRESLRLQPHSAALLDRYHTLLVDAADPSNRQKYLAQRLQAFRVRRLLDRVLTSWNSQDEYPAAGVRPGGPGAMHVSDSLHALLLKLERSSLTALPPTASADTVAASPETLYNLLNSLISRALEGGRGASSATSPLTFASWLETDASFDHQAEASASVGPSHQDSCRFSVSTDQALNVAWSLAGRLLGLEFEPRPDVPVPHPSARAFEVKDSGGHAGILLLDLHSRPEKRSRTHVGVVKPYSKQSGRAAIMPVVSVSMGIPGDSIDSVADLASFYQAIGSALSSLLLRADNALPAASPAPLLPAYLFEHLAFSPTVLDSAFTRRQAAVIREDWCAWRRSTRLPVLAAAFVELDRLFSDDASDLGFAEERARTLRSLGLPIDSPVRYASLSGSGWPGEPYALQVEHLWADREAGEVTKRLLGDPALITAGLARHVRALFSTDLSPGAFIRAVGKPVERPFS